MNHTTTIRILAFPLVTALAVNLAIVLATPMYRSRLRTADGQEKVSQSFFAQDGVIKPVPEPQRIPFDDADFVPPVEPTVKETTESNSVQEDLPTSVATDDSSTVDSSSVAEGRFDGAELQPGSEAMVVATELLVEWAANTPELSQGIANLSRRFATWVSPPTIRSNESTTDRVTQFIADVSEHRLESAGHTDPDEDNSDLDQHDANGDETGLTNVEIVNADTELTVAFLIENRIERLTPGESLTLNQESVLLRFDRGGDYGESRQTLSIGRYEFRAESYGWTLTPAL